VPVLGVSDRAFPDVARSSSERHGQTRPGENVSAAADQVGPGPRQRAAPETLRRQQRADQKRGAQSNFYIASSESHKFISFLDQDLAGEEMQG